MKAKNIKAGEYIAGKFSGAVFRVSDDSLAGDLKQDAHNYRRPTIADLNKGDVFEHSSCQWQIVSVGNDASAVKQLYVMANIVEIFEHDTKVRIVSLASEKVEPERKWKTAALTPLEQDLVEALEWYEKTVTNYCLVHHGGDAAMLQLKEDRGDRARALVNKAKGKA